MPIRDLFWDFDGTLYDSYPNMARAFLRALDELGHGSLVKPGEVLVLLKRSVFYAAGVCAERARLPIRRVTDAFQRYHEQESGFQPYTGVKSCLETLRAAGIRHYLYTHRNLRAVEQLKLDGLWPLFTDAVTREDSFPGKPAPDALNSLTARYRVDPREAAMVGDRDIDIEAGHNAGMRGVLFDPDGFYPELRAEIRAGAMDELCGLVLAAR